MILFLGIESAMWWRCLF